MCAARLALESAGSVLLLRVVSLWSWGPRWLAVQHQILALPFVRGPLSQWAYVPRAEAGWASSWDASSCNMARSVHTPLAVTCADGQEPVPGMHILGNSTA